MLHVHHSMIVEALAGPGWISLGGAFAGAFVRALVGECADRQAAGTFREAAVGGGTSAQVHPEIRNDWIHWLDPRDAAPAERRFLEELEALRLVLNRDLQLGLFEVESHFALYPPGASYARHVDQPRGSSIRKVSLTTYLNEDWSETDGGQLRLYLPEIGGGHVDVLPEAGTIAVFLSDVFEHEVLPPVRERRSLTSWFRAREAG